MRLDDERFRRLERALAANPGDTDAYLQLSLAHERLGQLAEAAEVAADGWRRFSECEPLREQLARLGLSHGPWPFPSGPCNRRWSRLPGPDEGVLRWRIKLPRRCSGAPLVDSLGRLLIQALPAGLMRVSPDGRQVEVISDDWSTSIAPVLRGDRPTVFDPVSCDLGQPAPDDPFEAAPSWSAVLGEDGRVYGLGPGRTIAIDSEGDQLWTFKGPNVWELVSGAEGPVFISGRDTSASLVVVLDRDTGALLRKRSWEHEPALPSIALAPDGALVTQFGEVLSCEEPDGTARWARKRIGGTSPAVSDELVVNASHWPDGVLGLGLRSGEPRWSRPELKTDLPPVIDARGHAYVLGLEGWVAGIQPDGEVAFRIQLNGLAPRGSMAIGYDRTLFFGAGRELVAIR